MFIMSIRPIETELSGKNKILRATSKEVKEIKSEEIQTLIGDMQETLAKMENGVGLAAPQVGVNTRIFVAAPSLGLNQSIFINPVITKIADAKTEMEEGCLSLPGYYGKVMRASELKVEARNQNGRIFKMKVSGLAAQLVQHEIGHLNGELFKDIAKEIYLPEDKRA